MVNGNYWKMVWILAIAIFGPGCGLTFLSQEIGIRQNTSQDTLEVLLIYNGVTATSDSNKNHFDQAVETAKKILEGQRTFTLLDPIFAFDLEEEVEDEDLPEEIQKSLDEVLKCISVEKSGAFLNNENQLCLYQKVLVTNLSFLVDNLNRHISRLLLEDLKEEGDQNDDFDERTEELTIKAAENPDFKWFRFDNGIIEVNMPLSKHDKDKGFKEFLHSLYEPEKEYDIENFHTFLSSVQSISYVDEKLTLRIGVVTAYCTSYNFV